MLITELLPKQAHSYRIAEVALSTRKEPGWQMGGSKEGRSHGCWCNSSQRPHSQRKAEAAEGRTMLPLQVPGTHQQTMSKQESTKEWQTSRKHPARVAKVEETAAEGKGVDDLAKEINQLGQEGRDALLDQLVLKGF
jgi:hypothetical protein